MTTIKEKKFKNLEALLASALEEFCQYNYETASLNRIIKNSETSKGSFYYHFKNKEDLYIKLLQNSVEAKWHYIGDYTKHNEQDFGNMDLFDQFLYQAEAGLMFAGQYPQYNKLGVMFSKEKGSAIYDKAITELNADTGDILEHMVHEAYKAGQLDSYYSEEFITALISHLFNSFDDVFSVVEDMDQELANLRAYVRFMKRGLTVRKD